MSLDWIGKRVVVRVSYHDTWGDIHGHISGTVVAESASFLKIKGRIRSRWYAKASCEVIEAGQS